MMPNWERLSYNGKTFLQDLIHIFPELRESEGERIRKELIEMVRLSCTNGDDVDRKIAWLEKRGQEPEKVSIWKHWKDGIAGNEGEKLIYLVKGDDTYRLTSCLAFECDYIELSELDSLMFEKQGEQKPADKAEPKFHEGDWVVNNNGEPQFSQVTARSWPDSKIKGAKDNFESFINTATLDKQYHLWTIQDAKDGDVLYCKSSGIEYIVMNKGVNEHGNIDSYFRYNSFNGFGIDIPAVLSTRQDDITPATKKQRDLLFSKMKDAGYEWDANKKELKKIEQNPTNEVGNYNHKEVLQTIINEQKPAWDEEDENMIQDIINDIAIAQEQVYCKSRCEDEINWLKSLKERVQPKQEWSEEDRRMLIGLIDELDAIMNKATPNEISVYSKYANWLNSIKDRVGCKVNCTTTKEWKPSDEQMSVIEAVINNRSFQRRLLVSLYEQLKKLRKE